MKPSNIALIPVYEPETSFQPFLAAVKDSGLEVVVVNDGSGPQYGTVFDQAKAYGYVISYPENKGKGYALKTGTQYIVDHFPDAYIVTMDADGQHTVQDAWRLLNEVKKDPSALWIGVRTGLNKAPLPSRFGNALTRKATELVCGTDLQDTQSGLRAFDTKLARKLLKIDGDRYEYEMNEILDLSRWNIPIRQMPIETIYLNNNESSHFHRIKDSLRIYRQLLKFSASSLTCFCIDFILYSLLYLSLGFLNESARILWSNIPARIISSTVNYTINRKMVFSSHNSVAKSALQYFLLAACILALNTLIITFLSETLGWNGLIAKICAELLCFIISFTVQKLWIFNRKKEASA